MLLCVSSVRQSGGAAHCSGSDTREPHGPFHHSSSTEHVLSGSDHAPTRPPHMLPHTSTVFRATFTSYGKYGRTIGVSVLGFQRYWSADPQWRNKTFQLQEETIHLHQLDHSILHSFIKFGKLELVITGNIWPINIFVTRETFHRPDCHVY